MTVFDTDNLSAPHTQRELGAEQAPAVDVSTEKYGRRNVAKMIRQVDDHRKMVRAEGTAAVQESWDAIEEHIDYAYGADRDLDRLGDEVARLTAGLSLWIDRAEAAEAEVARLREALAECETEIDDYIRQEWPLDHPVHDRKRQRDFDANPARAALRKGGAA